MANNVRTNKYAQRCWRCGEVVPAGQGRLFYVDKEMSEYNFETGWLVEHIDANTCSRNSEAQRKSAEDRTRVWDTNPDAALEEFVQAARTRERRWN